MNYPNAFYCTLKNNNKFVSKFSLKNIWHKNNSYCMRACMFLIKVKGLTGTVVNGTNHKKMHSNYVFQTILIFLILSITFFVFTIFYLDNFIDLSRT